MHYGLIETILFNSWLFLINFVIAILLKFLWVMALLIRLTYANNFLQLYDFFLGLNFLLVYFDLFHLVDIIFTLNGLIGKLKSFLSLFIWNLALDMRFLWVFIIVFFVSIRSLRLVSNVPVIILVKFFKIDKFTVIFRKIVDNLIGLPLLIFHHTISFTVWFTILMFEVLLKLIEFIFSHSRLS